MSHYRHLCFSFIFLALTWLGAAVSSAGPVAIQDNGGFFSEFARADAARNIGEIARTTHKDLVIETFKEPPADVVRGVNLQDKAEVNRVFEAWAENQARSKQVNGVYILLVKSPAHLQVIVGNDTQKRLFTLQDRETLVSKMLVSLRAKQYDAALSEAVSFVSTTMRAHAVASLRAGNAPGTLTPLREVRHIGSGSHGWLVPVLIALIVFWVIKSIIRGLFRGGGMGGMGTGMAGGPMMTPMSGGGGGGFFSSLLGGMFGAAAGNWMYDQFSGDRRSSSSWGAEPVSQDKVDQGSTGQDTDYSGSGGSFGDDSGGGGDSGGGDFGGGGDSGGGGDF